MNNSVNNRVLEFIVGIFIVLGLLGLIFLAFRVSGLTRLGNGNYYKLYATFSNVGGLKVRAPVSIAGVIIGRVQSIILNPKTLDAQVVLDIEKRVSQLPIDTSASIYTQGILGSNYISLTPGFEQQVLKPDDTIQTTHSAMILENLVGQLMYSFRDNKKS